MDTNPQTTWPPPPNIPGPLAAHDAFLTALVCAPGTKTPVSRMRLYRALQKKTGVERRQCWLLVRDYCERHGIFPQVRGLRALMSILPPLIQIGAGVKIIVNATISEGELAAAHTRHARSLILNGHMRWDLLLFCLLFGTLTLTILNVLDDRGRGRREAEEARRKVGNKFGSGITP